MRTPWGPSQTTEQVAEGILWVSTASHGGFLLSGVAEENMPAEVRELVFVKQHPWYEEDGDAALVVLFNPQAFTPVHVERAMRAIEYRGDDYGVILAALDKPRPLAGCGCCTIGCK